MLPWEHAAIAYLLYSGYSRFRYDEPPAGWPVLVVLFASQLPDLIDKPMAWQFGLFPSGRSVAHSVFVGVPLSLVVLELARRREALPLGAAFAIGYLSHLATDAVPLYPGASTSFESILWPLVIYEPHAEYPDGFVERTLEILLGTNPIPALQDPGATATVGVAMSAVLIVVWILDGTPGLRELGILLRLPVKTMRSVLSR